MDVLLIFEERRGEKIGRGYGAEIIGYNIGYLPNSLDRFSIYLYL